VPSLIKEPSRPRKPWRVDWVQLGRRRTSRFATRREAQVFLGDLARGARASERTIILNEWVPRWIKTHGLEWEPRTRRDRANEMDRWVLPWLGTMRLGDISRRDIRTWRTAMIEAGATVYNAQHAVKTLSTCLGDAVDDDILPANPCAGLNALQWARLPQEPATLKEVEAVRGRMPSARDRAAVSLLAYAGLRPGELINLRWTDVREHSIVVRRGAGRVSGATKSGSVRTVPIIGVLADDLAELERGEGTVLGIASWGNWAGRVWRPAAKAAGVARPPKALRHTAASLWIAEGRDVQQVANLLGHSTTRLVHDTYGHLFQEAQLAGDQDIQAAAGAARREAAAGKTEPHGTRRSSSSRAA
jgi:integrase